MIFKSAAQGHEIADLRAQQSELVRVIDEIRRKLEALTEAVGKAASERSAPPVPVDTSIVLRMLSSIEELSGKFYQVWEREKQSAREQRKGARAKGLEKQAEKQVVESEKQRELPAEVRACEQCIDLINHTTNASPLEQLRHLRAEHSFLYSEWINAAAQ